LEYNLIDLYFLRYHTVKEKKNRSNISANQEKKKSVQTIAFFIHPQASGRTGLMFVQEGEAFPFRCTLKGVNTLTSWSSHTGLPRIFQESKRPASHGDEWFSIRENAKQTLWDGGSIGSSEVWKEDVQNII
jgi:hypothetical protein